MCTHDKACGPCSTAHAAVTPWVMVQQAAGGVAIWGPISVEQVSEDDKLIEMAAIEAELPKLIERGRFTVQHRDMIAGEILHEVTVNPADAPPGPARALLESMRGRLPTAVLTVTPPIRQAFPHLQTGDRVAFAGGRLYADDEATRSITREVLEGKLDAFSISGVATRTLTQTHCDPRGCRPITRVLGLNLSATTLASTRDQPGAWTARARNSGTRLMVVQQSETPPMTKKKNTPTTVTQATGNDETDAALAQPETVADETPAMKAVNELARRTESLETSVAEMKGAPTRADPPVPTQEATDDENAEGDEDGEPEAVPDEDAPPPDDANPDAPPDAPPEEPNDNEDEEQEDDPMKDDKKDENKKVEQAKPADTKPATGEPLTLVLQAIERLDARLAAIEQANTTPKAPPAAAKAEARVAGPSVASTPSPSTPADTNPQQGGVTTIQQAARTGNPLALREALARLQGGNLQ